MKIISHGLAWIARDPSLASLCPECNTSNFKFEITSDTQYADHNKKAVITSRKWTAFCCCTSCGCKWELERTE